MDATTGGRERKKQGGVCPWGQARLKRVGIFGLGFDSSPLRWANMQIGRVDRNGRR